MPRFFIPELPDASVITGENARHISFSLRMKAGEQLVISDTRGTDYLCEITGFTESTVSFSVLEKYPCKSEPDIALTLYQAMPKLDKLELIVQKSVELGVTKIVPVLTSRCICRPDKKTFLKKLERLQKISLEAAKQSGRGIIPKVGDLISFENALSEMEKDDKALICYEKGGIRMSELELRPETSVSLLVGSEGGFSEEEASAAKSHKISPVWLGERILRCETAPIAAISIIQHLTGNL